MSPIDRRMIRDINYARRTMKREQRRWGQWVDWYRFNKQATTKDPVYDTGPERVWHPPVTVPVLSAYPTRARRNADDDALYLVDRLHCQPPGSQVLIPDLDRNRHGTYSSWCCGCRCVACVEGAREHQRRYRAGVRKAKRREPVPWRSVPIEQVREDDLVLSCNIEGLASQRRLRRNRVQKVGTRHYGGKLVTVCSGKFESSYTADHLCIAFEGEVFDTKHVVYLMKKGVSYRIGVSSGRGGPQGRLGSEKGDAFWALGVFDDREEALFTEALLSQQFNLPTWTFEAPGRGAALDRHRFWGTLGDLTPRAKECLSEFGLLPEFPFSTRISGAGGHHRLSPRIQPACNLLPGMLVATTTQNPETRRSGETAYVRASQLEPIEVSRSDYFGPVHSLEVERDHTYFADGILTHNCVISYDAFFHTTMPDPDPDGADHVRDRLAFRNTLYTVTAFIPRGPVADELLTISVDAIEVAQEELQEDLDPQGVFAAFTVST